MISYELAMGLSVVPLLMLAGSLNLGDLIDYQRENGWFLLPIFAENFNWKSVLYAVPVAVSFAIFLVAAFAETNRLPFDLPESETELVGGYHTEYSSMKFALFFLGEYAAMIVASSLMVVLFLGGWSFPGIFGYGAMPDGEGNFWWGLANIGVFFVKMLLFILFFIWVRWTLPRFRYDHLMNLGWKVFLPLAVVNVMVTAVVIAFVG
jgi:NADH-quinone oxidoreductase subunit H